MFSISSITLCDGCT